MKNFNKYLFSIFLQIAYCNPDIINAKFSDQEKVQYGDYLEALKNGFIKIEIVEDNYKGNKNITITTQDNAKKDFIIFLINKINEEFSNIIELNRYPYANKMIIEDKTRIIGSLQELLEKIIKK